MASDNATSADNQQERLMLIGWIVGFVDGEGTFSVSFIKNKTTKSGFQIFPEFVVTQGEKSLDSLKILKHHFGCGGIYVNRRHDNHRENLYRYCVRAIRDLNEKVIPFFKENQLRTAKQNDFELFVKIIDLINAKKHLLDRGRKEIAILAQKMNRNQPRKH